MSERGYKAEVLRTSKDLTMKERMMLKDLSDAIRLDSATQDAEVVFKPDYYAVIAVHNEKSKDRKDYENYVIVDTDGNKYATGSESFWNAFTDIMDEITDAIADNGFEEDYAIRVYRRPSKNYSGKDFITCSIV